MATIDLGKIKLVWRGTYAGGTAYTVDDVVQHTDSGLTSSFICTTASTGNAPSTGGTVHGSWAYLAKGAAGSVLTTQGDILFRDGSGDQRLAKGTGEQTLKMNSGATAPEWVTVTPPTSDFVKIQTTDLGSATTAWSVDGWVSATYEHYCIYFDNMRTVSNGGWWWGRFNIAGSTWTGSDYRYAGSAGYSGSHGYSSGNPDSYFRLCQNSTDANRAGAGKLTIYSPAETGRYTFFTVETAGGDGSTNPNHLSAGGFIQKQEAITGVTIIDNNGSNVSTGTMTIYGIKG